MAERDPRDETPDETRHPSDAGTRDEAPYETRASSPPSGSWAARGHTPSEPYTIHGDAVADTAGDVAASTRTHGGPDPIALVAGVVALVLAALAATGTLHDVDPRWVLAAGAVLIGGTVLVASLRRRA